MMQRDSEKEWYYGNKEKERLGPFSFKEVSNNTSILLCSCLSLDTGVLMATGEYDGRVTMWWTSISSWGGGGVGRLEIPPVASCYGNRILTSAVWRCLPTAWFEMTSGMFASGIAYSWVHFVVGFGLIASQYEKQAHVISCCVPCTWNSKGQGLEYCSKRKHANDDIEWECSII